MRLLVHLLLSLVAAWPAYFQTRPVRLMPWNEYNRQSNRFKWPYIIKVQRLQGRLFYYGGMHSYNPTEPQASDIEAHWAEFRPEIAFNEGGDPPIEKSRDEAVKKSGEAGLVRFLAARDKVPVMSLDPSYAEQFACLSRKFAPEQIKLFFVLRAVAQHVRNRGAETLDNELNTNLFPFFAGTPGLNGSPNSVAELETSYVKYLPNQAGYRQTPMSWFDPTQSENFLNEISRRLSDYRDEYMIDLLTRHIREGQRVFAVVGGSHVVRQASAIRRAVR